MTKERFTFSLGVHDDATVDGWDGLDRWMEKERAHWAWLVRGDGKTDVHGWASAVQNQWDQMTNQVASIQNQGQEVEAAAPYLDPIALTLLTSTHPDGVRVLEIRESAGDLAAAFAYAFIKGGVTIGSARNRAELTGAMLTVLPDFRVPTELSERLQRERSNYRSAIRSALTRIDEANDERMASFEETLSRGKIIAARMLRRRRDKWKGVQHVWQSQATQAVADIRGVEAAYLETMRLQAPVKYWQDKGSAHGTKERGALTRLVIFFPVALLALGWTFWQSATYLLTHASTPGAQTPLALYVIITGGLAAFSSILFWVGRLLTKLYLSEHHLSNDASERAIMTQTYLALTKEAAATEADRNIILAALFRNTTDGIVKEEGPGDFSLHGALSKLALK